jgi:hypothetical protein
MENYEFLTNITACLAISLCLWTYAFESLLVKYVFTILTGSGNVLLVCNFLIIISKVFYSFLFFKQRVSPVPVHQFTNSYGGCREKGVYFGP